MTGKKTTETVSATDFALTIMRQGQGATNAEATALLKDLIQRVRDTGKSGQITLTLRVAPIKNTTQVIVTDKLAAKLPEYDRPTSLYFTTPDGEILRDNPDQDPLFNVADLDAPDPTIIDHATGEIIEGNHND